MSEIPYTLSYQDDWNARNLEREPKSEKQNKKKHLCLQK